MIKTVQHSSNPVTMINELKVSEHFYSIQGEGQTAGRPAVFLRLSSCNLMCGGQGTEKDKRLHNGATWRCDSIESWLHGERYSRDELSVMLIEKYMYQFKHGSHLIVTGGEPLLQQKMLVQVLEDVKTVFPHLYIEVETNGTLEPSPELRTHTNLFNVSPKLTNSGMPVGRRIAEGPLAKLRFAAAAEQAIFKFVVSDAVDWAEVEADFVRPFDIPRNRIWLMPASDKRSDIKDTWSLVAEIAKRQRVNFSPRLQVAIWDQTTGV